LTIGEVKLHSAIDIKGNANNAKVLLYSYLNAVYESGFVNPIDTAIKDFCFDKFDISSYSKIDEIPYDFIRKRLSILVSSSSPSSSSSPPMNKNNKSFYMITKGAVHNILQICSSAEMPDGKTVDLLTVKQGVFQKFEEICSNGFRVLGVCYRKMDFDRLNDLKKEPRIGKDDEICMTYLGFLIFFDPIKPDAIESISALRKLGISLKIVSGDNRYVAGFVGRQIGVLNPRVISGSDLIDMSNEALVNHANKTDIFAEIEPNQKERIILALRKSENNVVGYIGDGINDASALHAADAGISVNTAADVVKDAADFVLLEKDLGILSKGVIEGRKTFANTLKYVFMATSANFGNMFSMAGASLFLPFLPLLPKQILLMNLFTDIPEMTISTDRVDEAVLERPRRMDITSTLFMDFAGNLPPGPAGVMILASYPPISLTRFISCSLLVIPSNICCSRAISF